MRSLAVILFVAAVAAVALYCAQRRTVARGHVLEAQLVEAIPQAREIDCPDEVPFGIAGATFQCRLRLANGTEGAYTFSLGRDGNLTMADEKTSAPWGR